MKLRFISLLICLFVFVFSSLEAGYVLKKGKLLNKKYLTKKSAEEHYKMGVNALEKKDWNELLFQMKVVAVNFPNSPLISDALYYVGMGYFQKKDYDISNKVFSEYLKTSTAPRNFEEVWQYKFAIANKFKDGAKRHMFGSSKLPKMMSAKEDALKIYDEIVATLPYHDLAAKSLLAKGDLLGSMKKFTDSVDTYQKLIKQFNKRSFAADAYLNLGKLYRDQSKTQVSHPDTLVAAKVNLGNFTADFPNDSKSVEVLNGCLMEMQENRALGFYERGKFYERTKNPDAAALCYYTTCNQFPNSEVAKLCRTRLNKLKKSLKKMALPDIS